MTQMTQIRTTSAPRLSDLRPTPTNSLANGALPQWVDKALGAKDYARLLVGIGVLRSSRRYAEAARLLEEIEPVLPAEWSGAWGNEHAALAWHQGRCEE